MYPHPFARTLNFTADQVISTERFLAMGDLILGIGDEIPLYRRSLPPERAADILDIRNAAEVTERVRHLVPRSGQGLPLLYASNEVIPALNLILDGVAVQLVLVTGSSDWPVRADALRHLDSGRVSAWFAQNAEATDPRLVPIPIGLAPSHFPHGDRALMAEMAQATADRRALFMLNLRLSHPSRAHVAQHFLNMPGGLLSGSKPYRDYLFDLRQSLYCVSPPGAGWDCHRTWEALYCGAVPIVAAGSWRRGFEALPMLSVTDWSAVTAESLVASYQSLRSGRYDYRLLEFATWQNRILAAARRS